MPAAPLPPDEAGRVAALHALNILDTPRDDRFDRITRTAARLFDVPIALVSLVDSERQWFKSCVGLDDSQTDREVSFCAHALHGDDIFVVEDARLDERFATNRVVTGDPYVRFYAGRPVHAPSGHRVGTLCIIDRVPRSFSADERAALDDLGAWVDRELASFELGRTAAALQASEEHLSAVLLSVADGVATFGIDGTVLSFNRAAEKMFRRPAEEIVGRSISDLVDEKDQPRIADLLAERARLPVGEEVWIEVTGCRGDGSKFLMDVAASELMGSDGKVFIAVARDISELSKLRRRNELILRSVGQGIIGADTEGRIVFANPAAAEMLGTTTQAMIGEHIHHRSHHTRPDGTPYPWEECPSYRTLRDGVAIVQQDEWFVRADGSFVPVEYSSHPIEEDGRVTGIVVAFVDITARRELDRMKDQFVSVVSHELRTPLTSIRGSLGLLTSGAMASDSPQAKRMLDIAVTNTDRLGRLVNDILDLERMRAGRSPLERRRVDVADLLTSVVQSAADVAAEAGVALFLEPTPAVAEIDADRVIQVLTNLVGNAVKFSEPGSTVWLGDQADGDELRIWVRDEGRGIPAEQLDRIFLPFEQVDRADALQKGGSGLGLAIARGIVEQHGGRLWAESEVGVGSTFWIAVPLTEEVA